MPARSSPRVGPRRLQDRDVVLGACLVQGGRAILRIVGALSVIECRAPRARVGPGPHQQADPLQVALLAELAQRHVRLLLELRGDVGPRASAVEVRAQRDLHPQLMEGPGERVVGERVGAAIQEEAGERSVADHQHVEERDGARVRAVRDGEL